MVAIGLSVGLSVFFFRDGYRTLLYRISSSTATINLPKFNKGSLVKINLQGKKVSLEFRTAEADKANLAQFSQNLGVGTQWLKGMSFVLDEQTAALLKDILPTEVSLQIEPKRIVLGAPSPYLSPESSSSGEKKITVSNLNDGGYILDINDPDQVLTQAVNSGQIQLSNKLTEQGLWQLLGKVDKIKIEVHGQNLNGEINLR